MNSKLTPYVTRLEPVLRWLRLAGRKWRGLPAVVQCLIGVGLLVYVYVETPDETTWTICWLLGMTALCWGYPQMLFVTEGWTWRQKLVRSLKHPLTVLISLVVLCLTVKEAFYPFSNFPMYSDPGSEQDLYYLAKLNEDGEREPVSLHHLAKLRSAKFGKIYKSYRDQYCEEKGIKRRDLSAADYEVIGDKALDYVHQQAEHWQLMSTSGTWQLVELTISYRDRKVIEEQKVLATQIYP